MIRKAFAILLVLVGLVSVAAGVWGIYTVQTNDELTMALAMYGLADLAPQSSGDDNPLLSGAQAVLGAADEAMDAADQFFTEKFGKSLTNTVNDLLGDDIDITNQLSMKLNICRYRTEILLIGVIIMQTGLLLWAWGRR